MNANMFSLEPAQDYVELTDIFTVLGEPEDPSSYWKELRFASLSGYDYIFISRNINSKLANKTSLSELLIEIYQLVETNHDRAKIFIYSDSNIGKPEFACFSINWKGTHIRDFKINPINNLEQKEFIRTIYEHSGVLVGTA